MSVANILNVFDQATEIEYKEGECWYDDAHNFALRLCPDNVWKGAGVVSAFSARKKWAANVMLATNAIETGVAWGSTNHFNSWAQRIIDGEHTLDVIKSPKLRAFAMTIATGESPLAVVDVHAQDIYYGRRLTEKTRPDISKANRYPRISDAYIEAAYLAGVSTATMQATTWVAWQRIQEFWWA